MNGLADRALKEKQTSLLSLANFAFRSGFLINNILILALIGMVVYFTSQTPAFLTFSNWEVLLTNFAAIGVPVAAMTLLVICGHVDLSVGSNIGFAGTITALASVQWGYSDFGAIAMGIGAGALGGLFNGVLCGYLRFNPIIVTLGTLGAFRGMTLLINSREIYGVGPVFDFIGNGDVFGIPILLIIVLTAFLLAALFVSFTAWGRHIYAIGVNPQVAFLAALPVRGLPFALYVVTGAAAGIAGVILVSRLDGASPGSLGLQLELQALTIILLGGVAFAGGRGSILGVLTAWVFLGVLENGLTLLNVTPFAQLVVAGLALVFAAGLDAFVSFLGPVIERRHRIAEQLKASAREKDKQNPASRTSAPET